MTMPVEPGTPAALPAGYTGPPTIFNPPAAAAAPPPPAAAAPPPAAAPAPPAPPPAPVVHGRGGPMDEEAIADRVKRDKRKHLRELYGTDDDAQIETIKLQRTKDAEDLAALRASKEKADRDQMSEVQRLTNDLDAANKKVAELTAQLAGKDREVMSSKQEVALASRLSTHKFIQRPAVQKMVKVALADHFNSLSKTAQAVFVKTGEIDRWLRTFAKDNPEFVVQAAAPPAVVTPVPAVAPPAAPRAPVRVPAGTARPVVPPRAAATTSPVDPLEGKTALPGRSNSMNKQELAEFMKRGRA